MRISDWSSDVCSSDLTDGIYGVVRHPQYTGIFLAVFGQLVHWPTILTLVLAPVIVLAYLHLARREEAQLRSEERRVGKECVIRVDLGGRRIIKKKKTKLKL